MWNRKHFLWYYVFSTQMRHLCGSLCILVYKNADVDNFYSKSTRSMVNCFYTDLKGTIMYFVEQKTFSVILRIFLTNEPPLWFPLYFGIQKCWRWQFLHTIVVEYGQIFYADLKVIVMCFVEQEIFSVVFLTIFSQNRWWVWLKCVCYDLKVVIICNVRNRKAYSVIYVSQMRHLCGSLCILVYKNADVDNFYSKSTRSMAKLFM